jgi:hypothetical protein
MVLIGCMVPRVCRAQERAAAGIRMLAFEKWTGENWTG